MAQLVKLEPGDVLVLANLGEIDEPMRAAVALLKDRLHLDQVLIFERDVDLSSLPADWRSRAEAGPGGGR